MKMQFGHGLPTVLVVALAAIMSYLINLATSSPTIPIVIGVVLAVAGASMAELWLARSRRSSQDSRLVAPSVEELPSSASMFRPGLKRYRELVGREAELSDLMTSLRDPGAPAVKVVGAAGGMGKTALAYEVAYRLRAEGTFEHVVWADAQRREFLPSRPVEIITSDYSFGMLLDDICKQCGLRGMLQASQDERAERVAELLAARRILIVLENFETVEEAIQPVLLSEFQSMRGQSRLLVNTRETKHLDVVQWPPLRFEGIKNVEDAVRLLRLLAKDEGFARIGQATQSELEQIFRVTGGARP